MKITVEEYKKLTVPNYYIPSVTLKRYKACILLECLQDAVVDKIKRQGGKITRRYFMREDGKANIWLGPQRKPCNEYYCLDYVTANGENKTFRFQPFYTYYENFPTK